MSSLSTDALTPDQLTELLGVTVDDVSIEPVGTGQLGSCLRLSLSFGEDTDLPASMVAKCPADDPVSRATGIALGHYRAETSFYRELAPHLAIRTPHCYGVTFEEESHDFVLLLEDLAPARQGDQIAGCDFDTAVQVLAELPKLHAPHWGDTSLNGIEWLDRNSPDSADATAMLLGGLVPVFHERYDDRLDPDIVDLVDQFIEPFLAFGRDYDGPRTIQHGDFRLDNMLFGSGPEGPKVTVVDWQTAVLGPGMLDVSYFIGAGLQTEDRRRFEADLVARYQLDMTTGGVDLTPDECWLQYRQFAPAGLLVAIGASVLVERTDRGDDMFVTMAQRHGRQVLDLDSVSALSVS